MNASAQHAPRIEPLAKRGASGRLGFGFRMPLSTMGVQSLTCNVRRGEGAGNVRLVVNHGSAVPYLQHPSAHDRDPGVRSVNHGSAVPYLQRFRNDGGKIYDHRD